MIIDRLLRQLISTGRRRGRGGEPVWIAVAMAAWLVRRARNSEPKVVWSGRVAPGERITVSTFGPGEALPES